MVGVMRLRSDDLGANVGRKEVDAGTTTPQFRTFRLPRLPEYVPELQ
jgi:hypothetical protein